MVDRNARFGISLVVLRSRAYCPESVDAMFVVHRTANVQVVGRVLDGASSAIGEVLSLIDVDVAVARRLHDDQPCANRPQSVSKKLADQNRRNTSAPIGKYASS